jgi:hypothetical protein
MGNLKIGETLRADDAGGLKVLKLDAICSGFGCQLDQALGSSQQPIMIGSYVSNEISRLASSNDAATNLEHPVVTHSRLS